MYTSVMVEESNEWDDTGSRFKAAIAADEFCLYCQSIVSLNPASKRKPFYEILLRLKEEELGLMASGTFLLIAQQHGLLPDLDRWVVCKLLDWVRGDASRQRGGYSINLAPETIIEPGFPLYVREQLMVHGLPGSILCFEFTESDALKNPTETAYVTGQLKIDGCRFALSGFGGSRLSFELLKKLTVDLLKIDGSLILNMLRNPAEMTRVKAINQVAHTMRIRTIAECVEDDATIAKLRELGVNYAQGFGVSRPSALDELTF